VRQLRVVNNAAEKGIKLYEEFNTLLTEDEEGSSLGFRLLS